MTTNLIQASGMRDTSAVSPRSGNRQLAERMWRELLDRMPDQGLTRIRGLLDNVAGTSEPKLQAHQGCWDGWHMPDLPTSAWLERGLFRELAEDLERLYPELRLELLKEIGSSAFRPYGLKLGQPTLPVREGNPNRPPGWDELKLWDGLSPTPDIVRLPASAKALRATLERCHFVNQFTYLSLKPGRRLPAHSDPTNWFVSVQMGIVVPKNCGLKVAGETRRWEEGRCLFFDNSFEHEAWNDDDSDRITLAIHVAHPLLTPVEREALMIMQRRHLALETARAMALWEGAEVSPAA